MDGWLTRELEAAITAATAAAKVCQMVQTEMVRPETIMKADRSPVTVADFGSQAVAIRFLREEFPGDPIVAEETSSDLRKPENEELLESVTRFVRTVFPVATEEAVCRWIDEGSNEIAPRYWCLDPVDGTKGFLRWDQYAVALALVVEGTVQLGVLACPNLPHNLKRQDGPRGVVFLAVLGEGAYQMGLSGGNAVPIRVSTAGVGQAVRFCESVESGHADQEAHGRVARKLGIREPSIRMDSQVKYGLVARGDAAIYLRLPNPKTPDYREKIWDHAPGAIIIQEAGGRVSDLHGKPLDFSVGYRLTENMGVVATNGLVHDQVLTALLS
jgi:3'(2'), 5'-bisphosphate nucleotidase